MFENTVLGNAFGPKRDEVTGEWKRLHNEELNDLYCSLYFIKVIQFKRMRWTALWYNTVQYLRETGKVHTRICFSADGVTFSLFDSAFV